MMGSYIWTLQVSKHVGNLCPAYQGIIILASSPSKRKGNFIDIYSTLHNRPSHHSVRSSNLQVCLLQLYIQGPEKWQLGRPQLQWIHWAPVISSEQFPLSNEPLWPWVSILVSVAEMNYPDKGFIWSPVPGYHLSVQEDKVAGTQSI